MKPWLRVAPGQEFVAIEDRDACGELDRPGHVRAFIEPAPNGADFDAQELGGLLGAERLFLRSRLHDLAFVFLRMQVWRQCRVDGDLRIERLQADAFSLFEGGANYVPIAQIARMIPVDLRELWATPTCRRCYGPRTTSFFRLLRINLRTVGFVPFFAVGDTRTQLAITRCFKAQGAVSPPKRSDRNSMSLRRGSG